MEAVFFQTKAVVIEDLDRVAGDLLRDFQDARVFALHGPMGVGKTTFVKFLCHQLGVKGVVNSPTFSIVNEYISGNGNSIFHFDFYRIKKPEEVFDLGCEEYFYSGHYCFIEWPEKASAILPSDSIHVRMEDRLGERHIWV